MSKPVITISPYGGGSPLPGLNALSSLKIGASYHEQRDCRHPLGVYNISIGRICDKVAKCADKLEAYWRIPGDLDSVESFGSVISDIVDYLDLTIYAAAEHVDDLEVITKTLYKTDREAAKSLDIKRFKKAIKPLRDETSMIANTIKHTHGRLRIYQTELGHAGNITRLVGFFIEGWENGGIAPHPLLHSGGKTVISVTSFLWNVLTYVGEMSVALAEFLTRINASDPDVVDVCDTPNFRKAAMKLARLPLYSFDDDHPFRRVRWVIKPDDEMRVEADSGIYGSLLTRWSKSSDGQIGRSIVLYAGDGATKMIRIAHPTKASINRWD
ncbi:hypothetical protein [Hoeflea sp. EC-HK425]|uniref:hypothetical protein n=1 Tax=Hoeflea sp. EC-HK425 TaxID=2038388 RepID=UPI001256DFDC|nr:hypothetical protein [Hoeflea sp. EC-HK425]VVT12041.1 conserved hypothetical protein [Hoeflea sp. EC-HK425]